MESITDTAVEFVSKLILNFTKGTNIDIKFICQILLIPFLFISSLFYK